MDRPSRRWLGFCAAAFLAGAGADRLAQRLSGGASARPALQETRSQGYEFTNPLLECDLVNLAEFAELRVPKRRIARIVAEETALGHISYASVYFRDLNNGPWFGINELGQFAPASLLKVPIMMAYLKWAEREPGVLRRSLCFRKRLSELVPNFVPPRPLRLGQCYAVDELIDRAIVDSDNDAKDLLLLNIDFARIEATCRDLGVAMPDIVGDAMTVKSYATFFRVLFNSSYLSRDMSEEALRLLSRVEFKTGLRSGVPPGIAMAHKFGERDFGSEKQLHDCGIVYYPRHPYLLCVMSRGARMTEMDDVIGRVSRAVFEEVSR
ncbi:MAG: class A beta-lactamase-related serine hydrolase [Elusimicrobia bacterium]|jgi:beta-lactamase class A|nr:class A beta-lactamase-related serine hydrolase [Elusimicrobiota bacterium]